MASFYDRVKMGVSAAPGTGAITLGAAAAGYRSFDDAAVPDATVVSYVIEDGAHWEFGHGTYTKAGTLLARTNIYGSSNANAAIDVSATATVFLTLIALDIAGFGSAGAGGGGTGSSGSTRPTIVQTAASSTQAGTNQIVFSAAPTPGNLIVVFALENDSVAPAAGWNSLSSTAAGYDMRIISRVAVNGDPASISSPLPSAYGFAWAAYEVAGASADDLSGATVCYNPAPAGGTTSATLTIPNIVTNSLVLGMAGTDTDARPNAPTVTGAVSDNSVNGYIGSYYGLGSFHQNILADGPLTITSARSGGNAHDWIAVAVLAPKKASIVAGEKLSDLSDVDETTAPTDGQVLTFSSAESKWKPGTIAASGGVSTAISARYWQLGNIVASPNDDTGVSFGEIAFYDASMTLIPATTVTASGAVLSSDVLSKVNDGNPNTTFSMRLPGSVTYDFGTAVTPVYYAVQNRTDGYNQYNPTFFDLYYSTDNATFTKVRTVMSTTTATGARNGYKI